MSDGRIFTSYLPNCELNNALQKTYGINDSHAYRYYLQKNAEKVMQDTRIGTDTCKLCPVCQTSLEYKPTGEYLVEKAKE